MTKIMMAIYTEPQTTILLLERCKEFPLSYCQTVGATEVTGVVVTGPAAGLLSDKDCSQYPSLYIKQIIEMAQNNSFTMILRNCGSTGRCTSAMLETDAKRYHFRNKADMVEVLRICPTSILAVGNLNPVGIFKIASPGVVTRQTRELLSRTSSYPNFVISSGCDAPPEVPFANIETFYRAMGRYSNECGR